MSHRNSIRVKCKCGYVLLQDVDRKATEAEGHTCNRWYHQATGERLRWCPLCGTPVSALSTRPLAGQLANASKTNQTITVDPRMLRVFANLLRVIANGLDNLAAGKEPA